MTVKKSGNILAALLQSYEYKGTKMKEKFKLNKAQKSSLKVKMLAVAAIGVAIAVMCSPAKAATEKLEEEKLQSEWTSIVYRTCQAEGELAEQMAVARQQGRSLSKLLATVEAMSDGDLKKNLMSMALEAYEDPVYTGSTEYQKEAIANFTTRKTIECYKRFED